LPLHAGQLGLLTNPDAHEGVGHPLGPLQSLRLQGKRSSHTLWLHSFGGSVLLADESMIFPEAYLKLFSDTRSQSLHKKPFGLPCLGKGSACTSKFLMFKRCGECTVFRILNHYHFYSLWSKPPVLYRFILEGALPSPYQFFGGEQNWLCYWSQSSDQASPQNSFQQTRFRLPPFMCSGESLPL